LKEAVLLLSEKNATVNEHYGEALLQAAPPEKTLSELQRILSERHGSSRLKEILKDAYSAEKGGARGFPEFLAEIEAIAREKLRADLQAKLLDEPAPDFSLASLKGDLVSLAGLRGRVVLVDFWASWCEPCLNSFPGMKRTMENFRNDRGVRFLFVNSWERVADRKRNAAEFMAAHDYPFEVLLDLQDKVIAAFQVEAIPTQFIIDGRGRVRFRNEGFPGNIEDQVEELAMMIDIVR
jgi:peroxiredoxin